jgi:Tfp pilus assembly protein PilE
MGTDSKYLTQTRRKDAKALLKENRPQIARIKYLTQRRFSETEALSREVCSIQMNVEITEGDFL